MPTSFSILLVDDDPTIADVLNHAAVSTFREANFIHVSTFHQAASYLEGLHGFGPRLILLDLNLQGDLNGLDFLTLLRDHPQGCLVPVIMLSANQESTAPGETYSRGANVFTVKPFSYSGWKSYVSQLRTYWFETVQTPQLWFDKEEDK
ncbi:response regulator [Spirosoma aerophilum]